MSGASASRRPTGLRRLERWAVGLAMSVVAIVLERIVMRSVRRGGEAPPSDADARAFGAEVEG